MAKVKVNSNAADPVWKFAKEAFPGDVRWNFAAIFIFDKEGKPIGRFAAQDLPKIEQALEKALGT